MPAATAVMTQLRASGAWARAREGLYEVLDRTSPRAFCEWNRRFPERHVVDASTHLVIEGYPSAANSLARETFAISQPGIRIASHLHASAHVRRALDLGVPVLVVLRPPVPSVASILARFPERDFDPAAELRRYERFYAVIDGLGDRVVLSRFGDTTNHLGRIAELMNARLGTSFAPFADDDPELSGQVRAVLDGWSRTVFGKRSQEATPRPSAARRAALDVAEARVRDADGDGVLGRCERLHERLARQATHQLERSGLFSS